MADCLDIDKQEFTSSCYKRFSDFQQKNQQCDFKVKVGSVQISVHKTVLAGSSDYFFAMFSHDNLENKVGILELKDVDVDVVQKCIDFMYNRDVSVTGGNCGRLMHVAHMLQLALLCDAISDYLGKNLEVKSFFTTKQLASTYGCKTLDEQCDQFALDNFSDISDTEEFPKLDETYVLFLIKSNKVNASVGLELDALLRWVNFDPTGRKNTLTEYIKHLDLLALPLEYRRYLIQNEDLINKDQKLLMKLTLSILDSVNVKPRSIRSLEQECSTILVFDKLEKHLHGFNTRSQEWMKMHSMTEEIASNAFSVVRLHANIYIFMANKSVQCLAYHDTSAKWRPLAPMMSDHGPCPPVAAYKGYIYVAGGGNNLSTTSAERYSPGTNTWQILKEKAVETSYSSIVGCRGYVYSIGGSCKNVFTNEVERYDPVAGTWTFVAPLKQERDNVVSVEYNGKIYIFGGYISESTKIPDANIFDPTQNVWASISTPKNLMGNYKRICAVIAQNSVYVIGGSPKSIEKYDTGSDKWETVTTLAKMGVSGCAAI